MGNDTNGTLSMATPKVPREPHGTIGYGKPGVVLFTRPWFPE